jgi:hypothetical protein
MVFARFTLGFTSQHYDVNLDVTRQRAIDEIGEVEILDDEFSVTVCVIAETKSAIEGLEFTGDLVILMMELRHNGDRFKEPFVDVGENGGFDTLLIGRRL